MKLFRLRSRKEEAVRLPMFAYERPQNLVEALELLATHGADCRILAGGTDLLVRMKQGLAAPKRLLSLRDVSGLSHVTASDTSVHLGAATPLARIPASGPIRQQLPGLVEAVNAVGSRSIQHYRGTIGGNLCQDNRCRFYNQSAFFRKARQLCHKAGGNFCYSWEGGSDRCHSSCQSDTAPALMAMDAQVVLQSTRETRSMPLADIYTGIGKEPLTLADDELLTEIRVPLPAGGTGTSYEKLAYRKAIDYPLVSAGAFVRTDGDRILDARLVMGAVAGGPLTIFEVSRILPGRRAEDGRARAEAADAARNAAKAFIADNTDQPRDYRMQMVAVIAKRALDRAVERALAMEKE